MNELLIILAIMMIGSGISAIPVIAQAMVRDWEAEGSLDVSIATYALAIFTLLLAMMILFAVIANQAYRPPLPLTSWILLTSAFALISEAIAIAAFDARRPYSFKGRTQWMVGASFAVLLLLLQGAAHPGARASDPWRFWLLNVITVALIIAVASAIENRNRQPIFVWVPIGLGAAATIAGVFRVAIEMRT